MPETSSGKSTGCLTSMTIDPKQFGKNREEIYSQLTQQQIETRPVWKPLHLQPVSKGCECINVQ
ncbi:DegT/DnrJ/EryC1/StrS aminotransferase [Stanieria sp. NIES-3757]|nr:DegT/DnrJ/EryC1/StrS aminotransferase [Stanieria sp. NIES-3757]